MNLQREIVLNVNDCGGVSGSRGLEMLKQINNVRDTICLLDKNFDVLRCLEAEQCSRFRKMKMCNEKLSDNLKEVEQRNTTMLNLFRANVTDELPFSLKNQVRRSWQKKYDALLSISSQLKRETHLKDIEIKEKNYKIAVLQQQLLNIGEKLTERDEAMKEICQKYLTLKKRKDEQELFLRKSVETLCGSSLVNGNKINNSTPRMSRMSLMPSKEALLAYETRRSDRLTRENCLLRASLQKSRMNCKCNSSDEINCVHRS